MRLISTNWLFPATTTAMVLQATSAFPTGYGSILDGLAEGLDIRLKTPVCQIDYGAAVVKVQTSDGDFEADAVVVTVPLGVLKTGAIRFQPELPRAKRAAIERLGMGLLNKLVVRFDKAFWPAKDALAFLDDRPDQWPHHFNLQRLSGQPVLVAFKGGRDRGPTNDGRTKNCWQQWLRSCGPPLAARLENPRPRTVRAGPAILGVAVRTRSCASAAARSIVRPWPRRWQGGCFSPEKLPIATMPPRSTVPICLAFARRSSPRLVSCRQPSRTSQVLRRLKTISPSLPARAPMNDRIRLSYFGARLPVGRKCGCAGRSDFQLTAPLHIAVNPRARVRNGSFRFEGDRKRLELSKSVVRQPLLEIALARIGSKRVLSGETDWQKDVLPRRSLACTCDNRCRRAYSLDLRRPASPRDQRRHRR